MEACLSPPPHTAAGSAAAAAATAACTASGGRARYQPRWRTRPTRRSKSGRLASVDASPSRTSFLRARVMATLMRRQSASSLPAAGDRRGGGAGGTVWATGGGAEVRAQERVQPRFSAHRGGGPRPCAGPRAGGAPRTRLARRVAPDQAQRHAVLVPPLALVHGQHLHAAQARAPHAALQRRHLRVAAAGQGTEVGGHAWCRVPVAQPLQPRLTDPPLTLCPHTHPPSHPASQQPPACAR